MGEPLLRRINREQMLWRAVDVERLIEEDHPARAMWELVGRLDLSGFYEGIECSAEEGGRPAFDPRLLISLWIYAYSQGIGSAREVARRCEWEPALQWLTGCEAVNYHTLASFRVEYRSELDELFTQVLGLLSAEGLIRLEQVVQDGTKIKAQAANDSFQGAARIEEHLERARRRVREMGEPDQEANPDGGEQARRRARRERQQRLEQALDELQKLRPHKPRARAQDCQSCPLQPQCCPGNQHRGRGLLRTVETEAMIAFRRKMATPQAQQQYRRRSRVIEFCHAWIKSKLGLRQFHLRGLAKCRPRCSGPASLTTSNNGFAYADCRPHPLPPSQANPDILQRLSLNHPQLIPDATSFRNPPQRLQQQGFFTASKNARSGAPPWSLKLKNQIRVISVVASQTQCLSRNTIRP